MYQLTRRDKLLPQKEQRARWKFRCVHRHNGWTHRPCYTRFLDIAPEVIGFLDIESSNLVANYGQVYCYCIKELDGPITQRTVTLKELYDGKQDKEVLRQFCKDITKYDRLILHYGIDRKFDLPFLRARAVKWRLPFPENKFCWVNDTQVVSRNKLKLSSNRLAVICDFLDIVSKKHPIRPDIWADMTSGNPKRMQRSLNYITVHCQEDVICLEPVWKRLSPYVLLGRKSI